MGRTADDRKTGQKARKEGFEDFPCQSTKCGAWEVKPVQINNWFECKRCGHTFERPLSTPAT